MKRVALVLALALTALAAPQAHAATACPKPTGLKVVKAGPAKVVLRWRKPRRGPFRVLRGKRVVGQTPRHSMTVNLRPGRKVKLAVGVVRAHGRSPKCYTRITAKIKQKETPAFVPTVAFNPPPQSHTPSAHRHTVPPLPQRSGPSDPVRYL